MVDAENRLRILEEQFVFQEKMVDELNEVIIGQQGQINSLEERLQLLEQKLNMLAFQPGRDTDPPPPHY